MQGVHQFLRFSYSCYAWFCGVRKTMYSRTRAIRRVVFLILLGVCAVLFLQYVVYDSDLLNIFNLANNPGNCRWLARYGVEVEELSLHGRSLYDTTSVDTRISSGPARKLGASSWYCSTRKSCSMSIRLWLYHLPMGCLILAAVMG